MATQSPFSLLESFLQNLPFPSVQPPTWVVDEVQRRVVLLLNHILMQESEAMTRLARQKSRVVQMHWRTFSIKLVATPAGLLDRATEDATPDLVLALTEVSPLTLVQASLRGDKPAVRIEGDVQLAAEVNWLTDHIRWDIEEDLARIMGDAPAHTLSQAAQGASQALRQFLKPTRAAGSSETAT
jgi:ubiquinone biosynthesis protein UbiJ